MVRSSSWALCVAVLTVGLGCKDGGKPGASPQASQAAVAKMEQLQKEESDFLARREELQQERRTVLAERQALAAKRKQAVEQGGDLQAVEKEEQDLIARETQLAARESDLEKSYQSLVVKYQEAAVGGGAPGDDVARREAGVAVREKDYARREEGLARREADLAARERDLAKREKEMCGGGTVTTIVQAAPPPPLPKGARYTRRDVEPALKKAHRRMGDKGILRGDLPSPVVALEKDATAAMADGDFARAKYAADSFLANVEAINVDRAFIAAKIGRLNAAMKANPAPEDKRKEVDDLFRGATSDYGDGKFGAANSKLNKIYGLIR